jgi:prolyl-tRNA synthetase
MGPRVKLEDDEKEKRMRTSQFLLATVKETPNDAELASHQLMIRAGLIRKLSSGLYAWLPLGKRVLRKVEAIVHEEMAAAHAVECEMPHMTPAELWQTAGRWDKYGKEMLKAQDRHGRDLCFGPTHEVSFTDIARREINSYKQLPLTLYQIQTKFRDEIRPRFGMMRSREFLMKDAYSFHASQASLDETYEVMFEAYHRIFKRLGLEARAVVADAGSIGGSKTHEFQVLAPAGEDDIFYSDGSDYAANVEMASAASPTVERPAPTEDLTTIDTPNIHSIEALCTQLGTAPETSVKTMMTQNAKGKLIAFIVRGDHELNCTKAEKLEIMGGVCELADEDAIVKAMGAHSGSLGPVNCTVPVVVDRDAAVLADFSCGANIDDKHFTGANWDRDVKDFTVEDVRNVVVGDTSPDGKGRLQHTKGVEVGHIFQLGNVYSKPMNATFLDENGKTQPFMMGCYGLGVGRVVAAAIEQSHDDRGIIWPDAMAPFDVIIVPMKYQQSEAVRTAVDELEIALLKQGLTVLVDDRKERPGVMFASADLIGIPHRVVVSERLLATQEFELKRRTADEPETFTLQALLDKISR